MNCRSRSEAARRRCRADRRRHDRPGRARAVRRFGNLRRIRAAVRSRGRCRVPLPGHSPEGWVRQLERARHRPVHERRVRTSQAPGARLGGYACDHVGRRAQASRCALHHLPGGQYGLGTARLGHRHRPEIPAGQGPQRPRRPQRDPDPLHARDFLSRGRCTQVRLPLSIVRQFRQERFRDQGSLLLQFGAELRPDADALRALAAGLRPGCRVPLPDRAQPRQDRHRLPARRRSRGRRSTALGLVAPHGPDRSASCRRGTCGCE